MTNFATQRRPRHWWLFALLTGMLLLALVPTPGVPVREAAAQTQTDPPCDGSTSADYNGACGPSLTLPRWSDAAGWNQPRYYETILLADFDGDGADELLARSSGGFVIFKWNADYGQWIDMGVQSYPNGWDFSDRGGWAQPQYYSTIQAAELGYNGGTATSLLMNTADGIIAMHWDGKQSWTALPHGPAWAWDAASNYATIQTWKNYLIGRADNGIQTWRFENGAWHQLAGQSGDILANSVGYDQPEYYETIKLVELNGDSRPELVVRGPDGVEVYDWVGDTDWSYAGSNSDPFPDDPWNQPQYYRTLMYGNIDGKAGDDLLGRGPSGMEAYSWNGSGWDLLPVHTVVFADPAWATPQYYETIQLVTLDANRVVLTARSGDGLLGFTYDAANGTFNELFTGPALADGPNSTFPLWSQPAYYDTIHYGDVSRDGVAELIARGQYGIRTWSYDTATNHWQRPVAYGFQHFSDSGQQAVFELVNAFLNIEQGKTIRDWYTSLDSQVGQNYQNCLTSSLQSGQPQPPTQTCFLTPPEQALANPGGVTAEEWSAMVHTLQTEVAMAGDVSGYFNESVSGMLNTLFAGNDNALATIAKQLEVEVASDNNAAGSWFSLLIGLAEAFINLAEPELQVTVDAIGAAFGAINSLGSSSTAEFEGKLADAQVALTNFNTQAIDNNNAFFQYVAQDYGLLYAVGTMVSDQTWLITADIQNAMVSAGRHHFAVWVYQLLLPTLWAMDQDVCTAGSGGDCPNYLAAYVMGPAGGGQNWARYLYDKQTQGILDPPPPAMVKLFSAVQDNCFLGPDRQGVWSYANCNLGVVHSTVFLMQDGWQFECPRCSHGGVGTAPHGVSITPVSSTIQAGEPFQASGTFTDPDHGPWTGTVDYGDGGGPQPLTIAAGTNGNPVFNLSHVYVQAGSYLVTVEVCDAINLCEHATLTVEVEGSGPPVINDIQVTVDGSLVTLTVVASGSAPLGYRFECAGGVIGPQASPTALCDFGQQAGQFLILVEVTDSEGRSVQQTVEVEIGSYFCAGERSGAVTYHTSPGCGRGERQLTLDASSTLAFCVGERSGAMRYAGTQPVSCGRGQWLLLLPEDGPITLCVGERSRSARYAEDASGCSPRGELVYVIANRVVR